MVWSCLMAGRLIFRLHLFAVLIICTFLPKSPHRLLLCSVSPMLGIVWCCLMAGRLLLKLHLFFQLFVLFQLHLHLHLWLSLFPYSLILNVWHCRAGPAQFVAKSINSIS
jgi:hypothetical protein